MLVFAFHVPGIVQRGNGLRRRAKLCLGLCALSSVAIDNEVSIFFYFFLSALSRIGNCLVMIRIVTEVKDL
jgi:hypothetical protein